MEGTPYVFLDESGDFNFGEKGSAYFVVTAVTMRRPIGIDSALSEYRYECLDSGWGLEYFHCAKDGPLVRRRVFEIIREHLNQMQIDFLVVEKSKTEPSSRPPVRFYPGVVGSLLTRVILRTGVRGGQRVVIVTDRIPVKRTRLAVERATRDFLPGASDDGPRYDLHHHESRSHFGLQVADYCCWAIQRKWSRHDDRYFALIEPALRSAIESGTGLAAQWRRDQDRSAPDQRPCAPRR